MYISITCLYLLSHILVIYITVVSTADVILGLPRTSLACSSCYTASNWFIYMQEGLAPLSTYFSGPPRAAPEQYNTAP